MAEAVEAKTQAAIRWSCCNGVWRRLAGVRGEFAVHTRPCKLGSTSNNL